MKILFKGMLIGIVSGIVGLLLGFSPFGAKIERNIGLNALFHLRGEIAPPENVVIVAISNQTGVHLDLPALPRDWQRSIHAQLIDRLIKLGAKTIVFDIHFRQQKTVELDRKLVAATKRADNVVLVEQVNGKHQPIHDDSGKIVGTVWSEELLQPFPRLAQAAAGLGTFTLPKTEAAVNGFWVFKESVGNAPTLPAVALQLYIARQLEADKSLYQQPIAKVESASAIPATSLTKAEQLTLDMQSLRSDFLNEQDGDNPILQKLRFSQPSLSDLYQGPAYRYINFYGPPGTIPNIPYHAVITGTDPNISTTELDFTGKAVFVGYSDLYDPGQPDRFYTVFTNKHGVDLSGVEIAATAFANLLNRESLKLPETAQGALILFLFGFLSGIIAYVLPAAYGITLVFLLGGLYAFSAQHYFNSQNLWLPLATPVLVQLPITVFLGLFGQYFLERKHGKHISEALNYYLPESAAKQLTQKKATHDSFNKVVYSTCFATDMAGFSKIAEQLPPGELALMLNDYFETLAAPLKKHGVDVTEFRADAIMCAWTAEKPDYVVRLQPILAALEAAEAMQSFKQRYTAFSTDLRIGLESGPVYIGHAGGGGHFVFSIVGDCANTASRIEGLNKHIGTQILATERVIEGLPDLLLRYLGNFMFVNKTEVNPIYEIMTSKSNASEEQTRLCEIFTYALNQYQSGEWEDAVELFGSINDEFPEDGPAKFFLHRAMQHYKGQQLPEDPAIINMQVK